MDKRRGGDDGGQYMIDRQIDHILAMFRVPYNTLTISGAEPNDGDGVAELIPPQSILRRLHDFIPLPHLEL